MSVLGMIKNSVFGAVGAAKAQIGSEMQSGQAMPQFGAGQTAGQDVDVEQVLSRKAQDKGTDLNWRHSIVDLMKLLDLDSSLENRQALAAELGYEGPKDGSAEMNLWLHRRVMEELERSGGTVPASLKE